MSFQLYLKAASLIFAPLEGNSPGQIPDFRTVPKLAFWRLNLFIFSKGNPPGSTQSQICWFSCRFKTGVLQISFTYVLWGKPSREHPGHFQCQISDFHAVPKLAFCKWVVFQFYKGNPPGSTQGTFRVKFRIFVPFQNWRSVNESYLPFTRLREPPRAPQEPSKTLQDRPKRVPRGTNNAPKTVPRRDKNPISPLYCERILWNPRILRRVYRCTCECFNLNLWLWVSDYQTFLQL